MLNLTCGQGDVVDFLGGDNATFKGLRQQTAVVGYEDWKVWCQCTTEVGFGLGEARLGVAADARPLIYSRTIGVAWKKAAVIRVVTFAAIQVNTPNGLSVKTETYRTLGKPD